MTLKKVYPKRFHQNWCWWLALFLMSMPCCVGQNRPADGVLAGLVVDPSGARVGHAMVHVANSVISRDLTTDNGGRFSASLPTGHYDVTVSAKGFDMATPTQVDVASGLHVNLTLRLIIAVQSVIVDVPADPQASTNAADNKNALVFDREQLAALSDDDATMQQQLLAMAGGDGQHPPTVYVDGFTGGRFPPKSSIREVRINQNPFSAQYDAFGMGRVEIFTKPGTDAFHGSVESNGNNAPFNARNPYTGVEPPYYSFYLDGHLSGPIDKKSSFFVSGNYFDQQNNAVVNAVDPTSLGALSEAVPNPQKYSTYSARFDRQMSTNNSFTGRYEYNQANQTNSGVGLLVLESEGVNNQTTTQTLQLGNTQIVSPKVVSETRFQYVRTRMQQAPVSAEPTLIVEGSFNGGGSGAGTLRDNQDRYEFQEYLSFERGKHFIKTGARYRLTRDANLSTANYNGEYIFPTLAAYEAKQPTQFNLTAGQPSAVVLTGDVGAYAEDEWKISKSVSLDYGLRFESQSAIPDHANWAPRVGFAWAIGQRDKKPAYVVLRGGFGMFYQRFASGNILTAIRQNGVSQATFYVTDPSFYPAVPTPAELGSGANAVEPTIYNINPRLRVAYESYTTLTAEHSFGTKGSISLNYAGVRDVHQYLSRNINAPLSGTYVVGDPTSGVRPLGGTQNIYQFSSDGIGKGQLLYVNGNLHPFKRLQLFGFYLVQKEDTDSSGATSFPSNQYDLTADYGRATFNATQRLFAGGSLSLPWAISVNPFVIANSATPFNITTGTDLNGDTQYNDRPAFATDLTRASVVRTAYGNFDTSPIAGQKIIPISYGNAPGFVELNLSVGKSVSLGPRKAVAAVAAAPGRPAAPASKGDAPYSLSFSVEAQNVFNHLNPGTPIGVLSSPLFGRSISLNGGFSGNSAANRTVLLHTSFNF